MSEYTPSTEEVRDDFSYGHVMASGRSVTYVAGEAFDRWLLAERARIWDEGCYQAEQYYKRVVVGPEFYPEGFPVPVNPYRKGGDA